MKKSSSLRLKLNRETLRVLVSPDLAGANGGIDTNTLVTLATCRISCGGTCGAVTCGVICAPSVVCHSQITC